MPSLRNLALSPKLERGHSRFDDIPTAFLENNVGTTIVELGRNIFIRVDSVLTLNLIASAGRREAVGWTSEAKGTSKNDGVGLAFPNEGVVSEARMKLDKVRVEKKIQRQGREGAVVCL